MHAWQSLQPPDALETDNNTAQAPALEQPSDKTVTTALDTIESVEVGANTSEPPILPASPVAARTLSLTSPQPTRTTESTDKFQTRLPRSYQPQYPESRGSLTGAENLILRAAQNTAAQTRLKIDNTVTDNSIAARLRTALGTNIPNQTTSAPLPSLQSVLSLPTSSPIAPAPSQDVVFLGESAPSLRLSRTPEPKSSRAGSVMSAGGSKIRERFLAGMSAERAKNRQSMLASSPASAVPARLQSPAVQDREARSPSIIPPVKTVPAEDPSEATRSERYETLLPGDEPDTPTLNGFAPVQPLVSSSSANLYGARSISINFGEQQRDHYKQTVSWYKNDIETFAKKVWPTDSVPAEKARLLLQKLRNITLHRDLNEPETQTQMSEIEPELQASWDVDTSSKFRFLKSYFEAAKDFNFHALLIVPPGQIVTILRNFLQGINVEYNMAADYALDSTAAQVSRPSATIFSTDSDVTNIPPPDVFISLQGSTSDESIMKIQSQLSRKDISTPVASLVVPRSVEHIEKVMPYFASDAEHLHVLMGTVADLRGKAGRESDSSQSVEQAATSLVDFMLDRIDWPFEELPTVPMFEIVTMSQASTFEDSAEASSSNDHGSKRPLDADTEAGPSIKKKKTGPSSSDDVGLTHVSDSVASQLATLNALRQQLRDHVTALEELQFQHEDQRQKLFQTESERDAAVRNAEKATLRITSLETKLTDLRTENANLRDQLREAKSSALDHTNPERAELEAAKTAVALAAVEQSKLISKAKAAEDNVDYVREQYQTASNMASSLGKANTALEAQVAELTKRASGEQVRLRESSLNTHSKDLVSANKKLRAEIKSREDLIMRKEEEITRLKEGGRGRMNTRQSSVPSTPRIGSPLAAGAVAGGRSSRQGSPVTAKAPHPLRNA